MTITKALTDLASKELMPTNLSSAQLRLLADDVRASSLFSARTTSLRYIEEVKSQVERMLSGEVSMGTARRELQNLLGGMHYDQRADHLHYDPATGFPGDTGIPSAAEGSIQDIGSTARVNLVLDTQSSRASNHALKLSGDSPDARYDYPAWELIRIGQSEKPRDDSPDPEDHWAARFQDAGGTLIDGRMIALKDDEVWSNLGDVRDDGIPGDVPPYAFNSGIGWDEIPRDEAIAVGLITEDDDAPEATPGRFFDESILDLSSFSDEDLALLEKGLRTGKHEGWSAKRWVKHLAVKATPC